MSRCWRYSEARRGQLRRPGFDLAPEHPLSLVYQGFILEDQLAGWTAPQALIRRRNVFPATSEIRATPDPLAGES